MPREVTLDARGPRFLDADDVDPEKGDVAVCQCGLSDEFPFCDGSHRATEGEADDTRYKYVDGERRVVDRIEFADESTDDESVTDDPAGDESAAPEASGEDEPVADDETSVDDAGG